VGSMTKVMRKICQGGALDGAAAGGARAAPSSTATALAEQTSSATSAFVEDGTPQTAATSAVNGQTVRWRPQQVDQAIVAFHRRHGAICEQYRGLRARLLSMNLPQAAQVIAITSAVPEEGKSVCAINLALVMAEGSEHRILLVDADFRRAALAGMLGIPRTPGLADVLRHEVQPAAALQPSPLPNLKVLPAGKVPDGAHGELLGSGGAAAVLAEFRSAFDYTFLDMPPITTVSDVSLLGPQCDGAVIVIQMQRTPEPTVQQAVRTLQANNIKVLGAVLSRCAEHGPGYYDYYDSSGDHD